MSKQRGAHTLTSPTPDNLRASGLLSGAAERGHRALAMVMVMVMVLGCLCTPVLAIEPESSPQSNDVEQEASGTDPTTEATVLDRARSNIASNVSGVAQKLDSLFADNPEELEANSSSLRMRFALDWESGRSTDFSLPVRVYLSLPNLEKRWQAFIASDSDDDELESEFPFGSSTPPLVEDDLRQRSSRLGISYIDTSQESVDLRYSLGGRINGGDLSTYAQIRARSSADLGHWKARWINKFYYFFDDGNEISTRIDLDRELGQELVFRSTSGAVWVEAEHNIYFQQELKLRKLLSERSAGSIGYLIRSETQPTVEIQSHTLFAEYRRNTWRDWVFVQVSPQIRFRQENDFNAKPALILSLDTYLQHD